MNSAENSGPGRGKKIVSRHVEVFAEIDPATYMMRLADLDMEDGETVAEWVDRLRDNGDTARDMARELDLLADVTITVQVFANYDDGTRACVDRGDWTDQ